ncbi:hypothetical protein F4810DRAFT_716526 [Camillea tinctor]|nr:hypothetical protein F4810DRAFT_716526 [Camillea tinctor]
MDYAIPSVGNWAARLDRPVAASKRSEGQDLRRRLLEKGSLPSLRASQPISKLQVSAQPLKPMRLAAAAILLTVTGSRRFDYVTVFSSLDIVASLDVTASSV